MMAPEVRSPISLAANLHLVYGTHVARVFLCPPSSCSHSEPNKHTDTYII